ncbi:MAG: hypothetical protein WCP70_02675 [Methanothrix sp.]
MNGSTKRLALSDGTSHRIAAGDDLSRPAVDHQGRTYVASFGQRSQADGYGRSEQAEKCGLFLKSRQRSYSR